MGSSRGARWRRSAFRALAFAASTAVFWASTPNGPSSAESAGCLITERIGSGGQAFHLIGSTCTPQNEALEVTVFLHGFFALDPRIYGSWTERLASEGRLVVFPAYQSGVLDLYQTDNAAFAVRRAMAHTEQGWRGRAFDWSGPVYVGHSWDIRRGAVSPSTSRR